MRFIILTDDHPPPHVHVRGNGDARIALHSPHAILSNKVMRKPDIARARNAVEDRWSELMKVWTDLHG
jgi:hypothetical protein